MIRDEFTKAFLDAENGDLTALREFARAYGESMLFQRLLFAVGRSNDTQLVNEMYLIASVVNWVSSKISFTARWECYHRGLWGEDYKVMDLGIEWSKDVTPRWKELAQGGK